MANILGLKKLSNNALPLKTAYEKAAGIDIAITRLIKIENGIVYYGTDYALEIPEGYCVLLFPRSSMGKKGWRLSNSIGLIDEDYKGEVIVALEPTIIKGLSLFPDYENNLKSVAFHYPLPDYIVQLVLVKKEAAKLEYIEKLSESKRGEGGFGSSG